MIQENQILNLNVPELVALMPKTVNMNPAVVYISRLASSSSRYTMKKALNILADIIDPMLKRSLESEVHEERFSLIKWSQLRYQHTNAIRARLIERYSPATVNKQLAALRGVLEAAFDIGIMTAEDYHRARKVSNVKNTTLPAGRDIAQNEVLQLLRVCGEDSNRVTGARDATIILVLWRCGLRRSEVVNLRMTDFNEESRKLKIRGAKGRKDRTVYVPIQGLSILETWLYHRGYESNYLFLPIRKSGDIVYKRNRKPDDVSTSAQMSTQAIYNIVNKRASQADIINISPHDFRRTIIGELLDKNVDIVTVSDIVGHSDPMTTKKYDRRPERTKRDALDLLEIPKLDVG